jgi:hypothetical protein
MKKAGVMQQTRNEPRFADLEVPALVKPAGASARLAVIDADISDADFETVQPPHRGLVHGETAADSLHAAVPGLGLLRRNSSHNTTVLASDDQLSPGFLAITLILALAVFWLCGGHALLY